MRILHTSDWHLGISLHHQSLLEEQRECIRQMTDLIRRENIKVVIVAGDVFDSRVASSEAIALYSSTVTQMCQNCGTAMTVIAGNHDGAARLASCSALLQHGGLYVTGKLPQTFEPLYMENTEIFSIPYFHTAEVQNRYPNQKIDSYEAAMRCLCDEIRSVWTPGCRHIVTAHAFVTGAELSQSDGAALLGGAQQVGAQVFTGFDYTALGHLHRAQQPAENVHYSGSPYPYSFGEAEQQKTVSVYDTETGEVRRIALRTERDLRVISGTLQEVMSHTMSTDDYVKIEITDQPAGAELLETLRKEYPHLLCVAGKSSLPEEERVTLTAEEIETLSPEHILEKFCRETADYIPTPWQIEWFRKAFTEADGGGDLQ